ncbi:MAG: hypothetical protein BYD32DRAFT_464283 [Podila humilis]|nr:MAG: hypothetical protein BYD32DRAFT_464283 [Podila humilis]
MASIPVTSISPSSSIHPSRKRSMSMDGVKQEPKNTYDYGQQENTGTKRRRDAYNFKTEQQDIRSTNNIKKEWQDTYPARNSMTGRHGIRPSRNVKTERKDTYPPHSVKMEQHDTHPADIVKTERHDSHPAINIAPIVSGMANINLHEASQPFLGSPINFAPIVTGMANINLQEPSQFFRHGAVDYASIVSGVENMKMWDQLQRHISPQVEPHTPGLANVDIHASSIKKEKDRSDETPRVIKALTKLTISESSTSFDGDERDKEQQQQTTVTGKRLLYISPVPPLPACPVPIFDTFMTVAYELGAPPFETIESLVNISFQWTLNILQQHTREDEAYHTSRLIDLPKEANLRKLRIANSWLDALLTRNWLESLRGAYDKPTSDRALVRKKVWAFATDQVRGLRHSRRYKEMMEEMFGPTTAVAGQDEADTSSKDPLAAELRDRIEVLKKKVGETAAPTTDHFIGEEQDQSRARMENTERASMARSINTDGLLCTKTSTLLFAASLVDNMVRGRWYSQMRTRAPLDKISTCTEIASSWANVMDECYATVEAYLAQVTERKFCRSPLKFNDWQ